MTKPDETLEAEDTVGKTGRMKGDSPHVDSLDALAHVQRILR